MAVVGSSYADVGAGPVGGRDPRRRFHRRARRRDAPASPLVHGAEYPDERRTQRDRTALWIRVADVLFAAALAASALTLLPLHIETALVLIGAAVLVVLAFAVMEPATERAAFNQ